RLLSLPPFPTRRSSDLQPHAARLAGGIVIELDQLGVEQQVAAHVPAACADLPDALALEPGAQEPGEALAGALGPARELVLAAGRSEEHTSELQSRENLV